MKQGYFKTKFRLWTAIAYADDIEGMQEHLDFNFAYQEFELDYGSEPTWMEALDGALFELPWHLANGAVDYAIDGIYNFNECKLMCQYVPGMYERRNYGDLIEIDDIWYRYIASVSCVQEVEHQAGDGGCCYDYRGDSFIRILEPISETWQDEYPIYNGSISLINQILWDEHNPMFRLS